MPNPLFQQLGGGKMPGPMGQMKRMMSAFQQFKTSFQGDPKQEVQRLLESGQMSQQQYNQLQQMAADVKAQRGIAKILDVSGAFHSPYMNEAAEEFGRAMVDRSRRIHAGEEGLVPPFPQMPSDEDRAGLPPPPPKEVMMEQYRNAYKRFTYIKERCTYPDCTLCVDNCPMGGINLSVDPPRIARPCMLCQFCDQICPTGAIQYSVEALEEMAQMDKEANFEAAAIDRCREYEKAGIFRRYVPEDKVGWDSSIVEVYDQHPRFVIGKGRVQGVDPWEWSGEQNK